MTTMTSLLMKITILMSVSASAVSCPLGCSCPSQEPNTIYCLTQGLREIPVDIPQSTTMLNLDSNAITSIVNGAFTGLTNLTELVLSRNQITTLDAGVFLDLQSLQMLQLHRNSITSIVKGAFTGLTNLKTLHLSRNHITTLDAGVFLDLQSLQMLQLHTNSITSIVNGAFTGLTNLITLSLSSNYITTLDAGMFLGLQSLQTLYLRRNSIASIVKGAFEGLFNLTQLFLDDNDITYIAHEAFVGLHGLSFLSLPGNNLINFSEDVVRDLKQGIQVNFVGNPLHCDCHITGLQHLLKTGYIESLNSSEDPAPVSCKTPAAHASKHLVDISPRDLVCVPQIQTDDIEIYLEVTTGDMVEMVCPVIGDPSPNISWSSTTHQTTMILTTNGSLTIDKVTESDAGNYTCIATNPAGSDQIMYLLRIVQSSLCSQTLALGSLVVALSFLVVAVVL